MRFRKIQHIVKLVFGSYRVMIAADRQMSYFAFPQEENKFPTCVAFTIDNRISGHFFMCHCRFQSIYFIYIMYMSLVYGFSFRRS